jgi:hypothetical protein
MTPFKYRNDGPQCGEWRGRHQAWQKMLATSCDSIYL